MGRKSTAQSIIEEGDEDELEDLYLVSYDFIGEQPHHRFWSTLGEIISLAGGRRIQYSVYYGNRKGAMAVLRLARRYGADVRCFAAIELA